MASLCTCWGTWSPALPLCRHPGPCGTGSPPTASATAMSPDVSWGLSFSATTDLSRGLLSCSPSWGLSFCLDYQSMLVALRVPKPAPRRGCVEVQATLAARVHRAECPLLRPGRGVRTLSTLVGWDAELTVCSLELGAACGELTQPEEPKCLRLSPTVTRPSCPADDVCFSLRLTLLHGFLVVESSFSSQCTS